jgi:CBS domain-containing protein
MNAVYDIMSPSPVTVEPTTSIGDLLALFDRHDFNAFPVVKHHHRLVGIVSKLDVLKRLLDRASTRWATNVIGPACVADVMRRNAVFVNPRDDITAAANLMVVTKLRSLPVIERRDGRSLLVGMLSRGDVLRSAKVSVRRGPMCSVGKGIMTLLLNVGAIARPRDDEARDLECRQTVESFIDEISEQSFPASDPPAWGAASSRLERAVWCPPTGPSGDLSPHGMRL